MSDPQTTWCCYMWYVAMRRALRGGRVYSFHY